MYAARRLGCDSALSAGLAAPVGRVGDTCLRERLDTKHVVSVGLIKVRRALFGGMLRTQEGFCLDGTVACFFLISFEDDKRRGLGTATPMTVRGVVLLTSSFVLPVTRWFGFVGTLT